MSPPIGFRTFADAGEDDSPRPPRGNPLAAPRDRLSHCSTLVVVCFAAVMLLFGLGGDLRVLTQHEVFAAEPAREMLASGDWVMPRFAGVPRLNKPPGMYWLIASSMWLFDSRAEWVDRLPAALAGVLLSLLVARLTARWLGCSAGLVAGLMQASVVYVIMQARLSEADMPMALCVALAMAAFAAAEIEVNEPRRRGRRILLALLFGVATGASVELKGVGILFIYLGCILWIVLTRRWRSFRFLFHPVTLASLILVAGAWPVAIYLLDPATLRIWWRETFGRATGEFGESESWFTYFINLPYLLLPWWPFAFVALVAWWRRMWHGFPTHASGAGEHAASGTGDLSSSPSSARVGNPRHGVGRFLQILRLHPRAAFLLCWFAAGMIVLHVSAAKHKHYAIPMLPPITIVSAVGFAQWLGAARRGPAAMRQKRVALAITSILGAAAIAWLYWRPPPAQNEIIAAIVAITIGVSVTIAGYAGAARRAVVGGAFGTALLASLSFQLFVLPSFDDYKSSAALARRANQLVPDSEPILLLKLGEVHAAYYLDHPLVRIDRVERRMVNGVAEKQSQWEKFLRDFNSRTLYILCPMEVVPMLRRNGEVVELDRVEHLRKVEKDLTVLVRWSR